MKMPTQTQTTIKTLRFNSNTTIRNGDRNINAEIHTNTADDLDDMDGGRRGRKQLDDERRTDDDVDDEHGVAVGRSDEEHGGGCERKRFDSERMKDGASESAARFGEMCERKRRRIESCLFSLSVSFSFFYFLFFLITRGNN